MAGFSISTNTKSKLRLCPVLMTIFYLSESEFHNWAAIVTRKILMRWRSRAICGLGGSRCAAIYYHSHVQISNCGLAGNA